MLIELPPLPVVNAGIMQTKPCASLPDLGKYQSGCGEKVVNVRNSIIIGPLPKPVELKPLPNQRITP